jgi:hypothetical protein
MSQGSKLVTSKTVARLIRSQVAPDKCSVTPAIIQSAERGKTLGIVCISFGRKTSNAQAKL